MSRLHGKRGLILAIQKKGTWVKGELIYVLFFVSHSSEFFFTNTVGR